MSRNSNDQSERLQLTLLDDSLDLLLSAAEAVSRDDGPRSLKEAVLHLGNGVELLVKARIAREHWSLIFADVDKASRDKLDAGDFASVDAPRALNRLEQIVGVPIGGRWNTHLKSLRQQRNRLTHFTATLDTAQTKSLVAKVMAFCVSFCEQQGMATARADDKLSAIHKNLTPLQEFVDHRIQNISANWKDALLWVCPECWQPALVIDGGEVDCKFCKRKADPLELAAVNAEGSIEDCPECDVEQTFVYILRHNGAWEWLCFSCGQGGAGKNYDHCMRCGRMDYAHDDNDGIQVCEECQTYIIERW